MSVTRLPEHIGPPPNDPVHEFLFEACQGLPVARQRRIILRAIVAGFCPEMDAEIVADALGVELGDG